MNKCIFLCSLQMLAFVRQLQKTYEYCCSWSKDFEFYNFKQEGYLLTSIWKTLLQEFRGHKPDAEGFSLQSWDSINFSIIQRTKKKLILYILTVYFLMIMRRIRKLMSFFKSGLQQRDHFVMLSHCTQHSRYERSVNLWFTL